MESNFMSIKSCISIVFELLLENLDLELSAALIFVNKELNQKIESKEILIKLAKKYNIELTENFSIGLRNISKRTLNKWSILNRSADWVLKKSMRDDNHHLSIQIMKRYGNVVSESVKIHYEYYVMIRLFAGDIKELLSLGQTSKYILKPFAVELARREFVIDKKMLTSLPLIYVNKYIVSALKRSSPQFINKIYHPDINLDHKIFITLYTLTDTNVIKLFEPGFSGCTSSDETYKFYCLLRGGRLDIIKSLIKDNIYTKGGEILLGSLYSMNLECIEYALQLGPVDIQALSICPYIRDLGSSPGETTPFKLHKIKQLFNQFNYDVKVINKIITKFVVRNDDIECIDVLVNEYGVTHNYIFNEAYHENAKSIYKYYTKDVIKMKEKGLIRNGPYMGRQHRPELFDIWSEEKPIYSLSNI